MIIYFVSLVFVLENYVVRLPENPAESLRFGYKEVVIYTESVKDKYDKIIFSKSNSEPQAFVAFYANMDPKAYQQTSVDFLRYQEESKTYLDQLSSYNLEKYEFRDIDWSKDKKIPNILMVGKSEEFPENVSGVKIVNFPNGKVAFKIVESEVKTANSD